MSIFKAEIEVLGTPIFQVINPDPIAIAQTFQEYLTKGSQLTGVSIDDIDLGVRSLPSDPTKSTLVALLECGMKLFDAVAWISFGRPASHKLKVDPSMEATPKVNLHEISRAVFYVYFFLLTQARYPAMKKSSDDSKVPNFLRNIMKMDRDQSYYVKVISSFEPAKFGSSWIRHIKFEGLGQEAFSRFGLGVAGYRLFGPFKLYAPKPGLSQALMDAYSFARKVAIHAPTWDIHPLTRKPSVLTSRGNLNKNLGNLILEVFTKSDIDEMVSSKILYSYPKREPAYMNYKTWSNVDDISGTSLIFG